MALSVAALLICENLMTYLVLDEELDTLNGSGGGLRDGGGNTTHYKM
jgi:hypothetical protein